MKITIIGAGYVGLVTGTCFADFGFPVTCVDKDESKVASLNDGRVPIYEPGLSELIAKNAEAGRLAFTTDLRETVEQSDVIFIAVGTPSRRGDGHADLEYVYGAAREIARSIKSYTLVITKSTVPVGTGDEVERIIGETVSHDLFSVASNPEFLREGAAIEDFKRPDRVICGISDERARKTMEQLYRPLSLNRSPVVFTDRRTAELTKYAANAFLATKITFINEMADICEAAGANVQDVARGIGLDRRIGSKFLHAGPGFGGSCFPKDTLALVKTAQDLGTPSRVVETVVAVNDQRKRAMARKVIAACGGSVRGKTVAVLGLTFKPNTDDMREAPSIAIVRALQDAGAAIRAFDPAGMGNAPHVMDHVDYSRDAQSCLEGADAMVLVTEWDMLRGLDPRTIRSRLKGNVVVDLRNVYDPEQMRAEGLTYIGIGR